jgi:ribonuclease-3
VAVSASVRPEIAALRERLGAPVAAAVLDTALTHPSASSAARPDYQRLEFLGDRVLMLVIAQALLERHPDEAEGQLAPRLNALVRKETCAAVAAALDLGAALRMERGDARSGGRKRVSTLGDAMEAVIAAIYLDQGLETAREVVLRLWAPHFDRQGAAAPREPKSALQEWAEGRGLARPDYVLLNRDGPDHAPRFEIEARLADGRSARAVAASKRAAEKAAAAALLREVEHE